MNSAVPGSSELPGQLELPARPLKPGRGGVIAVYLFLFAQTVRTLTAEQVADRFPWYLGLTLVYIVLFTIVLWKPGLPRWLLHAYFCLQSLILLVLLRLDPTLDMVISFFVPLGYQVALVFTGYALWGWVGFLALLSSGSLMVYMGILQGLAVGLATTLGVIVFPAYAVVNQEIETARLESQALLTRLQSSHEQLQAYASQVEELAVIEARNRLARELHDTVSQYIFSILLITQSAQIMLEKDQPGVAGLLERLHDMTSSALSQLRSLITQLRPSSN
jgi:signal transduction histidine kinase